MKEGYADLPAAAKGRKPVNMRIEADMWQRIAQRLAAELGWLVPCNDRCLMYHTCPAEGVDCGSALLATVYEQEEARTTAEVEALLTEEER